MSNMTLAEQLRARLAERELAKWAEDDPAHKQMEVKQDGRYATKPFAVTNNLSRVAFEQIKNHPDTRKNTTAVLKAKGYLLGSISAIIGQMIRNGYVQLDDEGIMHTTIAEYQPVKNAKTLRNRTKKAQARKKVLVVNVREKTVREEGEGRRPVSSSVGVGAGLTALVKEEKVPRVDALLRSLSVLEARDLYEALRNIFGGNK